MSGRTDEMLEQAITDHELEIRQRHEARARTGADLVLHGAALDLINEGLEDNIEAFRLTAKCMINEILDHGFTIDFVEGEWLVKHVNP